MSLGANKQTLMGAAGAGGGVDNFYSHQIAKSCRFDGAGKYLRTNGSAPTLATKYTFSTWVKRAKLSSNQIIFGAETDNVNYDYFNFRSDDLLEQASQRSTTYMTRDLSVFRDVSAFYHLVFQWDTTLASATDRLKVYVNGVRLAWGVTQYSGAIPQDTALKLNQNGASLSVAYTVSYTSYFNGYMAQTAGIDGNIVAIGDLGETKNGVWIAKDLSGLTFGNNGFLLDYASSGNMGNDVSGNNNDFTPTSISTHDQMLDSPTFNSNSNGGNFATWNFLSRTNPALSYGASTFSEGNLAFAGATGGTASTGSTFSMQSGKWYAEVMQSGTPNGGFPALGVIYTDRMGSAQGTSNIQPQNGFTAFIAQTNGNIYKFDASSGASYGSGFGNGDICNIAVDINAGKIWWGKNGTWFNSGNPATGAYPGDTFTAGRDLSLWVGGYSGSGTSILNAGSDGTFAGAKTAQGNSDDTGYGNFYYTPKTIASGFLALCAGNLPIPASIDPAQTAEDFPKELFFMSEYAGNSSGRTITTENQPDLIFNRQWNYQQDWYVLDSNRVITDNKVIITNTNAAESVLPQGNVTSVGATSVGISSGSWLNSTGSTYQMWMWRANGGTTSTNSTGSVNVTQQVDPSGGLSISTYSGAGGTGTIGHGLSSAPTMVWVKQLNGANNWAVYAKGAGNTQYAYLDTDAAFGSATMWQNTTPSSSLVYLGDNNEVNHSGRTYVAYCFADVEGYMKSDSYVGNGNADGTFVYTGFRPAFVLNKPLVAGNWRQQDIHRSPFNITQSSLSPNSSAAYDTGASVKIDLLSNGFKMRDSQTPWNQTTTFVYLAFAENPFKYATAR